MQYTALHGEDEEQPDMQRRPGAFGRLTKRTTGRGLRGKGRGKVQEEDKLVSSCTDSRDSRGVA